MLSINCNIKSKRKKCSNVPHELTIFFFVIDPQPFRALLKRFNPIENSKKDNNA